MKRFKKEIIIIAGLTVLLSFIRYMFIDTDYSLIKRSRLATDMSSLSINSDSDSLLSNVDLPTVISLELAFDIHKNKLATFIDARSFDEYNESHIQNSINIPFDSIIDIEREYDLIWMNELNENYIYTIDTMDYEFIMGINDGLKFIRNVNNGSANAKVKKHETIFVIYCSGEGCSLSEDLAFYMYDQLGYEKILIYEGGLPEWKEKGYPVIE